MRIYKQLRALMQVNLSGWKRLSIYLVTLIVTTSIAYIYFDEEIYTPYLRAEKKAQAISQQLARKKAVVNDYQRIKKILDSVQNIDVSCPGANKLADCQSNQTTKQRLALFKEKSDAFLVTFTTPWAVLTALSQTTRQLGLTDVSYRIPSLDNPDKSESIPLYLKTQLRRNQLLPYMQQIDDACKSCAITLSELKSSETPSEITVELKINLYLDWGKESKAWQKAISDAAFTGDRLENYQATPTQ